MTSLNCIPQNIPSLCIPRVFSNISRDRIFRIVDELGLGRIHGIDMVPKVSEKGDKYNRIFIHFTAWSTNPDAEKARQIALSGGEFKILYDDPYFWKVSASTCAMPMIKPSQTIHKPKPIVKPIISFDTTPAAATTAYPTPESRRAKYGPRPDLQQDPKRQDPKRQDPKRQDPRREDSRQDPRQDPRRQDPRRQDSRRQDPRRQDSRRQDARQDARQEKEDKANIEASSQFLDSLEEQLDPKEMIRNLNKFCMNNDDDVIMPPKRRSKGSKKVVKATEVAAVVIEIEDEDEDGEIIENA